MTHANHAGRFLPILRDLHARGLNTELVSLIQQLKQAGYPKSILRAFELLSQQDSVPHPYHYEGSESPRNLGIIVSSPLVSVIVAAFNSAKDLERLLCSLQSQSYTNLELIIVNNSEEDLRSCLADWKRSLKYLNAPNPGFAEANNLGLEEASGDLLLLLNPDTELQKESIKELVHALEIDATAAAAIPLIYFSRPFYKVSLTSQGQAFFAIDLESLVTHLHYKKIFVRDGERREDGLIHCNIDGHVSFDVALNPDSNWLELAVVPIVEFDQELCLQIKFEGSGEKPTLLYVGRHRQTVKSFVSARVHSSSRYLINNAGSGIRPGSDEPYDIGFGEVDIGKFANRAYRQALCGCCALLRRDLFIKRKIFISEFFAYYEDSELSYWLRSNQMNILYVPSAIVYHRHSESTGEFSPLWKRLVSRSAEIYHSIGRTESSRALDIRIESFDDYKTIKHQGLISTLKRYDAGLAVKTLDELITRTKRITVGIYNSFWDSFGGGERHALDMAEIALQCDCEVYLISENHFSLDRLRQFFQTSLTGVKTLTPGEVSESLTQRFDIFINSTFYSRLVSRSKISYYIVSFPHKHVNLEFLSSYVFLHNSEYTYRWALRYWGDHRAKLLLPVLSFQAQSRTESTQERTSCLADAKSLMILSVGRFNYEGHCKNQHMIANVFARLSRSSLISEQWQLVMAGSVDSRMDASISHFKDTEKILAGCQARLVANAEREEIEKLYCSASIYIHAAGLGVDPISAPEKNEHFGIAPFESLLHGCLLIAFHHGGPAAMLNKSQQGLSYRDEDELEQRLLQAVSNCEQESLEDRQNRIRMCLQYSLDVVEQSMISALSLFHSV